MGEEEEVLPSVLICQVLIQPGVDDGGKRSGMRLVGYVPDNLRLGKEEEEALRLDGHNDNNDGYRGGGGGGGGKGGGGGGKKERVNFAGSIILSNNTYFTSIPLLIASCNFCYL
jgi:hypothetical protein